ncbi:MAG UNVERIFIED_CONTAM: hypothetical protein LVR18_38680 [Planctomycetaceae bacterium]
MSPRPAPSNDCGESSGPIGSDEGFIAAHPALPEAAGIVPATRRRERLWRIFGAYRF